MTDAARLAAIQAEIVEIERDLAMGPLVFTIERISPPHIKHYVDEMAAMFGLPRDMIAPHLAVFWMNARKMRLELLQAQLAGPGAAH